jgi:hypothetical protein
MFFISLPKQFKIGDTVDCRINLRPARVTWRDADTLVIEPADPRAIITWSMEGDLIHFTCGDSGEPKAGYEVGTDLELPGAYAVHRKPPGTEE